MSSDALRWHEYPNPARLSRTVAELIGRQAEAAIANDGRFRLVLAGGTTPRAIYEQLCRQACDWARWEIFFGDERCLPVGHPERNDTMAAAAWLDHVPLATGLVHFIPAELGPRDGAKRYSVTLAGLNLFDLVLLGLGEDGHTASLFPGGELGARPSSPAALPVEDAPKPPAQRVSLSAQRLSRTRALFFVVTGAGKRAPLAALRQGDAIPAAAVRPLGGADVHTDQPSRPRV